MVYIDGGIPIKHAHIQSPMHRFIGIALISLTMAEAIVVFNDSAIVDESDFMEHFPVPVTGFCRDLCHVYASVSPEHRDIADKILIQTAKGFVSVAAVADQMDHTTKRKQPLEIKNMPTLTITNTNVNYKSGNIVVYVVNHNADYFDSAEVYEAAGLDRKPSFTRAITILSASPFTLTGSNYMANGVIAKLAGFDTLDGPTCAAVYSLSRTPFPGFQMTINGPIISLLYDLNQYRNPAGELRAQLGFSDTHRMEQNGFFASAGWHGCNGRLAYQSSLYNQTIGISHIQDVTINVQTNSKKANSVIVTGSDGKELARYHDNVDSKEIRQFRDSRLNFDWTSDGNTHYLVRYNSTAKPIY